MRLRFNLNNLLTFNLLSLLLRHQILRDLPEKPQLCTLFLFAVMEIYCFLGWLLFWGLVLILQLFQQSILLHLEWWYLICLFWSFFLTDLHYFFNNTFIFLSFFSNSSFSSILFYCLARSLIRFFISATCVLFLTVFVLWYFFALFLYHVYYSFRFAMILYINLYSYHFRNFLLVLANSNSLFYTVLTFLQRTLHQSTRFPLIIFLSTFVSLLIFIFFLTFEILRTYFVSLVKFVLKCLCRS